MDEDAPFRRPAHHESRLRERAAILAQLAGGPQWTAALLRAAGIPVDRGRRKRLDRHLDDLRRARLVRRIGFGVAACWALMTYEGPRPPLPAELRARLARRIRPVVVPPRTAPAPRESWWTRQDFSAAARERAAEAGWRR